MIAYNTKNNKSSNIDKINNLKHLSYEKTLKLKNIDYNQFSNSFNELINKFNSKKLFNGNNLSNCSINTKINNKEFIQTLTSKVKKKLSDILINNDCKKSNKIETNNISNCSTNNNSSNNSNKLLIDIDNINKIEEIISSFELKKCPPFDLKFYIMTICDTIGFEKSTIVYAINILNRFLTKLSILCLNNNKSINKKFNITSVYKLAAIVLFISMKINEDDVLNYNEYSELVGFDIDKLWNLEKEILEVIDYNLIVNDNEYFNTITMIIQS